MLVRPCSEQFAIDGTSGPRSGRIYLAVQYGGFPKNVVGAFHSDDDGKSWVGPIDAAAGSGKAINTANPMVPGGRSGRR